MTEYEIYSYEAFRRKYQDNIRPIEQAGWNTLDRDSLERYLDKLKAGRPNLSRLKTEDICELVGLTREGVPTLAAVLLFSLFPQGYFPQLCVTVVSVPGTEIGQLGPEGERFLDNRRIEGTLTEILEGALAFVRKNIRLKTIIDPKTGKRADREDYPLEKMPPSPPKRRGSSTGQERLREQLSAILSQQLSRVSSDIQDTGIDLSNRAIIGDNLEQPHQVNLEFYEEREKEYDKKGRLKPGMTVSNIMPDRPFILEKAADLIVKMAMEKATAAIRKEQEQASHTPHMVPAGELFAAAAKAILRDLRPLGFSLFADTPEGLVKVKKQEASGKKNLNLSWKK